MDKPKTMNELMRYYDHRIEELELKLAIAEEENSKLKSRSLSTATGSTVLNAGAEAELYPDEIHEVLVDVIKDARRNILDGSRRADIIDDILKHNPVQKVTPQPYPLPPAAPCLPCPQDIPQRHSSIGKTACWN